MPSATQADFDAAVSVNMADFGMDGEEAVAAAVEELELQGLDLTGIVRAVPGTAPPHAASIAAATLVKLVDEGGEDAAALCAAVAELEGAVTDADGGTIAVRAGAVPALLAVATPAAQAALATLLTLTPGTAARDAAVSGGGVDAALGALAAAPPLSPAWTAAARLAASLATKHEGAKAALVAGGLGGIVAASLGSASDAGAAAAAAAVAACATADDARPLASSAFQHGRALAAGGALPAALLAATADPGRSLDAAAAAARAARRVLVNDDLVRAAAGLGPWPAAPGAPADGGGGARGPPSAADTATDGVAAALAALRRGAGAASTPAGARLARSAAGLARQLAGSDAVKPALIGGGALAAAAALAPAAAAAGQHGTVEQALGLVAALTLRNPAGCEAAAAAGCVAAIAAVLAGPAAARVGGGCGGGGGGEEEEEGGGGDDDDENGRPPRPSPPAASQTHQWAQRQACAAARNLAARAAPDGPVAAALQAARLTPLLRAARRRYPAACADVGAAALRDLGVEDYNAA